MSNNKNTMLHLVRAVALALASLVGSGLSMAAEIEAELRAGYLITDNIFRTSTDETSDFVWTGGMSLDFTEETSRISADIRGVINYLNYDRTYESESIGGLNAKVDFTLVNERLIWTFRDNYGQRLLDSFGTPNAANREDVNIFSTGPILQMPIGSRQFVGLEGRYSSYTYDVSANDNDRIFGRVRLGRRTSKDASISLDLTTERVDYSGESLSGDVDLNELFIAYEVQSTRNIFKVEAGYTQMDFGDNILDGSMLRINWTRVSSLTYRFLFSGGSQYSTQGDIFRFSQSNGREIGGTVDVVGINAPFRSHFFYTRYNLDRERTRIAVELEWNQDDYEFQASSGPDGALEALDRDVVRARFFVERDISRKFFANFSLGVRTRKYKYIDREDDDFRIAATLGYRFSPAFNMFVSHRYFKRDSSDSVNEFVENRAFFGISYVPSWGR